MIRAFDILFSLLGIIILSPLLIFVSLAIVIDSKGGAFYSQTRVGKGEKDFKLYKFRSMGKGSDKKGLLTVGDKDSRVTRVGYWIRKYKLDELPQLFNVLEGKMSLVGPRPEVRKYVDLYTEGQRKVLSVHPGITDYASIEYINENNTLAQSADPHKAYIEQVMPDKILYNMKYIENYSIKEYFRIIFLTIISLIR